MNVDLSQATTAADRPATFHEMVHAFEASLILAALKGSRGNQRRAAAALGILPTTLCEKMKRLRLRRADVVAGEAKSGNPISSSSAHIDG